MTSEVRTRFAPSPTGYMHLGGMRTALFTWLFARHHNGTFILRIDDTDQQRNVEEALEPILHAFRWLELDWDEGPEVGGDFGPYFQSQRTEIYHKACSRLIGEGKAFRDFDPPSLSQQDREAAEKEKRTYLNIRRSLDLSDEDIHAKMETGEPYVIRLLVPREHPRKISLHDAIRGEVEWDSSLIADPVIFRSNGMPLYNFASVVDDAEMKITHVIRAEEHLSNTPIQLLLHEALGSTPPVFAHIPFVASPQSTKKLSKREKELQKLRNNPAMRKLTQLNEDVLKPIGLEAGASLNPVMVSYYEQTGFLPAGLLNALARVGWSYDDKTENMSLEFITEQFTLERVVKKPAAFDPDKLMSYQQHWMNQLSLDEKVQGTLPFLVKAGLLLQPPDDEQLRYLKSVIEALGERLRIFGDILQADDFFRNDDQLRYDEKAFEKRITKPENAISLLQQFRSELEQADSFEAESLDLLMHAFVEQEGIKIGEIIHAVRVAATGKAKGPGMFETLAVLGKEKVLNRIDLSLKRCI